jgi:hypothetical protein
MLRGAHKNNYFDSTNMIQKLFKMYNYVNFDFPDPSLNNQITFIWLLFFTITHSILITRC